MNNNKKKGSWRHPKRFHTVPKIRVPQEACVVPQRTGPFKGCLEDL